MARILVTGAGGFVASHLAPFLARAGHDVVAVSRSAPEFEDGRITVSGYPRSLDQWSALLGGVDAVVHLAAVAHRRVPDQEQNSVTRGLAAEAAEAAHRAGIRHFIFVSSIAAQTGPSADHVLAETDTPRPVSAYGAAKLAAEAAVRSSGAPFTVLRPVVIDGPGAKGSFGMLNRIAALPLPLPVANLQSRRSTLSIANFNAAVATVLFNPGALGETFVVADLATKTVAELVAQIRLRQGRSPRLFAVPQPVLRALFTLLGRDDMWQRLSRPLVVDPAKLVALGWKPVTK